MLLHGNNSIIFFSIRYFFDDLNVFELYVLQKGSLSDKWIYICKWIYVFKYHCRFLKNKFICLFTLHYNSLSHFNCYTSQRPTWSKEVNNKLEKKKQITEKWEKNYMHLAWTVVSRSRVRSFTSTLRILFVLMFGI